MMTDQGRHLPPELEADLAALADGLLCEDRRAALTERALEDPRLAAALDAQRRAMDALAATNAQVEAPESLRAFVGEVTSRSRVRRRRRRLRLGMRPWAPAAGLAVAAVACALVLVAGGAPVVDDVVEAAQRPPTAAIATAAGQRMDGVAFPDHAGWRTTGTRTDTIGDRSSRTVFYVRGDDEVAYTVVAGEALEPPLDARPVGGGVRAFTRDGRAAVIWEKNGQTCVLSGIGVDTATLKAMAVSRYWA